MNEFLNPKSMATPGIAGSVTIVIANAITNQFPEFPFRYSALLLSFLIGAIVFNADNIKNWERPLYWIINSLIIFSVGTGATYIGRTVSNSDATLPKQEIKQGSILFFIESAQAAESEINTTSESSTPSPISDTATPPIENTESCASELEATQQQLSKEKNKTIELQAKVKQLQAEIQKFQKKDTESSQNKSFFNPL